MPTSQHSIRRAWEIFKNLLISSPPVSEGFQVLYDYFSSKKSLKSACRKNYREHEQTFKKILQKADVKTGSR